MLYTCCNEAYRAEPISASLDALAVSVSFCIFPYSENTCL
jgi:hypothetical protein